MKENSPLSNSIESQLAANMAKREAFPFQQAGSIRLIKLLHKLFSDEANLLLRDYGLTYPEYTLLILLDGSNEGLTPTEIATAICEKAANTTRLVDQLLGKALVEREACADDRRRWRVKITPAGDALIAQVLPAISAQLQEFFSDFSAEEFATLNHLLHKLIAGVSR